MMAHFRIPAGFATLLVSLSIASCGSKPAPMAPTALNAPLGRDALSASSIGTAGHAIAWQCVAAQLPSLAGPFGRSTAPSTCAAGARESAAGAGCAECVLPINQRIPAPSSLSSFVVSSVIGFIVQLNFNVIATPDIQTPVDPLSLDGFIVEAGSAPGLSDLAVAAVVFPGGAQAAAGSSLWVIRPLEFLSVPSGIYYVRVRSYAAAFFRPTIGRSLASEEIAVVVGNACQPSVPLGLSSTVSGSSVSLAWTAPTGCPVGNYVIEAGSAPGLRDLAYFSTGTGATSYRAFGVGRGTYYVRIRAANGNLVSGASNEVVISVP